ncbi:ABC transporter substrate-binding protein [Azospirillum sp. TSO22-1]|uniref:ABC transporter substrate-binding protein n=1 Tax=Azospirillum sp. TSO22-1 TaxID=716789 RepID=UPI000D612DC3|nr:ABC transporter substrate-binding protein [Azospirillum sp. TSO22-1]PWC55108.1 nitrate ABC transporter substrate-binding protein [Azospirillum sp. TSO22-1]
MLLSRRTLLTAAAALGGLALSPRGVAAATRLRVGYIPIIPMTQLFVLLGEGWARDAGLDLQTTGFQSGPAMIQALASGTLDVAYVGIGPAMIARSKGVPVKIVAANIVDQVALIGRGPLAQAVAGAPSPAEGFAAFRRAQGRPAKIATLPAGSVPETVLRYWLQEVAKVPAAEVEVIGMGEEHVQQALLSGAVDGSSILEPILTVVRARLPDARILVPAGQLFPRQPGAVVAVTENAIARERDAVAALVRLHVRATDFAKREPARTAEHVGAYIGKGLIEPEVLQRALTSDATTLVADPRGIVEGTGRMQDFQQRLGQLASPVDLDTLFDFSFYDAASRS